MTEHDITIRARIAVGAEFSQTNLENSLVVGLLTGESGEVLNDDSKSDRFFVVEYQETSAVPAQDKIKYFLCAASDGQDIYGKPMILTQSELDEARRKASDATGDEWHIAVLSEVETIKE